MIPGSVHVANKRHGATTGVYVGRPSFMGNPYSHLPYAAAEHLVADRDEAVARYGEWLNERGPDSPQWQFIISCARKVAAGHDVTLICWCAPLVCHADVLKERIEAQVEALVSARVPA